MNDDLLVDCGPDIAASSQSLGRSLFTVQFCLLTHSHSDHFYAPNLLIRSPEYGVIGAPQLHLYASTATIALAVAYFEAEFEKVFDRAISDRLNLEIHEIQPFGTFEAGRYRVTAYPAKHDVRSGPLLYAITDGSKSLFYGVDTAAFPEETWEGLQADRWRFDYALLDHSYGTEAGLGDHLSPQQFREHVSRMHRLGLLKEGGRVFAHHISHSSNLTHPEMVKVGLKYGYEIPYDGLSLT